MSENGNLTILKFLHCADIHLDTPFAELSPEKSEERRRELVKQIQKFGEEAKVAVRNIRRDANDMCKKMKKDGEMTEDEQKASEKSVQDLTDKYIKNIETITTAKENAVMKV